jgi:hypothetical protein
LYTKENNRSEKKKKKFEEKKTSTIKMMFSPVEKNMLMGWKSGGGIIPRYDGEWFFLLAS